VLCEKVGTGKEKRIGTGMRKMDYKTDTCEDERKRG
jgi:hypothetical protein